MGRGLDGLISRSWKSCAVLRDRERFRTISGGFSVGETPLPIPNRAVKPHSADGTWLARAWESRSPPVLLASRLRAARRRFGRVELAGARDLGCAPWLPRESAAPRARLDARGGQCCTRPGPPRHA